MLVDDDMLTRDGVIARYILGFCFFFLPFTEMLTGNLAAVSGVLGVVEITTAILRYSPLNELLDLIEQNGISGRD